VVKPSTDRYPTEAAPVFLTAPDEYFNHQTSFPNTMVDSSDQNWRERYWFSFQDVRNKNLIVSADLANTGTRTS
jgi:hypothetical protein